MELYELNNLLHKVKNEKESLEFQSEEHIATVNFINNRFLFVLNGKGLFSYKSLRHFRNKLDFQIVSKNLQLIA